MITVIILAVAYAVALKSRKIWGKQIREMALFRDMDLSFKGFIAALGIVVLLASGITISTLGSQLYDMATVSTEKVYAQTNTPVISDVLPSVASEETTATEPTAVTEQTSASATADSTPVVTDSQPADVTTQTAVKKQAAAQTAAQPAATAVTASASQPTETVVQTTTSQYADGTYSGTARGFKGPITVAVQIAGGIINSVEVTDQRDDQRWFERAYAGVVQRILAAQSANVDTVSGATYSSNGIIGGAAAALEQARAAVQ